MIKLKNSVYFLPIAVLFCFACNDSERPDGTVGDADSGAGGDADSDADGDVVCDGESFEVLEGGYVCAGLAHGYAWTSVGEVEGGLAEPSSYTTLEAGGNLCITGTTATDYSSLDILGVSANQDMHTDSTGTWTPLGTASTSR